MKLTIEGGDDKYPAKWYEGYGQETMLCDRHFSCQQAQGRFLAKYEALSSYPREELDEDQIAFIEWFESMQALV